MKRINKLTRGLLGGLILSIGLALSGVAFAQEATPSQPKKEAESCCSAASCCKGDSCSMKDHAKKDHSKEHVGKDGCCCCKADSCQMKSKDKKDS